MEHVLEVLGKVPWALILTVAVFPLARKASGLIHDKRWRAIYEAVVAEVERQYGAGSGEVKAQAVKDELARRGIPFDRQTMEAAVVAVTK